MKKILTIIVVGISILFITACNSNNENNVAIDVDDNIKAKADTITLCLPIYKFANTKVHDTLLSIVNNYFLNDLDAVSIVYFPIADTNGTYSEDSIPYLYNLYIETIHYFYTSNTWKDDYQYMVGCSMIDNKLCYIKDELTLERLFVKTSETICDTFVFQTLDEACACAELDAYCYLFDNDSLFFKSDLN